MANQASLEEIAISAFRNAPAGTEVATAILAIEAIVLSGLNTVTEMVKNENDEEVNRSMVGLASVRAGAQLADALSTLDAIIEQEGLELVAYDKELIGAQNEATLREVAINSMAQEEFGLRVADMVSLCEQVIDALIVAYGPGGATPFANVETALKAVKSVYEG